HECPRSSGRMEISWNLFFFQAEDGIRDFHVTGVQTCALPICYSRRIEDVVENAFTVEAGVRVLVVEGNYLLLADPPWSRIGPMLDLAVFIEVPREMVRERLLNRHAAEGLFSVERNVEHVERVDLANYDLVKRSRSRAVIAIDLITES